jgi:hypothetical protein
VVFYKATLQQFAEQGEKTGWTYLTVPAAIAQQLKPGNKKSFRVKGWLDDYAISKVALIPMGEGDFIMAVNAGMRKAIKKHKGATVDVKIEVDTEEIKPHPELMECLQDEPAAKQFFSSLPKGHQLYFTKWIGSAKTEETKTKRIAQAVTALAKQHDFGLMLRTLRQDKDDLMGL